MYTTITIKTNKVLRDEAKAVADKLGVPLTTVINAYLSEFVRERKLSLSLDPSPTNKKLRLWESICKGMDKKSARGFTDPDKLISYLGLE